MTHWLKIKYEYFKDVIFGLKKFELRKDDRNFQVGDWIRFEVLTDDGESFKAPFFQTFCITYILRDVEEYGLMNGYCILGIERLGGKVIE